MLLESLARLDTKITTAAQKLQAAPQVLAAPPPAPAPAPPPRRPSSAQRRAQARRAEILSRDVSDPRAALEAMAAANRRQ